MYSIVLMVAMTQGAATPTSAFENGADFNRVRYGNHLRQEDYRFGRRGRRGRRGGCCGGGWGNCCGGGWGGWNSCGCCGGGYGGGWGCCGGGYGGGWGCCGGGYGGGWGCCGGGYAMPISYGCTGGVAYEGSMGGWGQPAPGGMGAPPARGPGRVPMPAPAGAGSPYRYNYGSGYNEPGAGAPPAGGFNQPGLGAPPAGGVNEPGPTAPPVNRNPAPEPLNPPASPQTRAEAPATFTVHLPANAKLFVDNRPTVSTSTTRTFITPPLPENRTFSYTLKAQLPGTSKPVIETKTITVRGGQNTDISLPFPQQRLTRK